MDRHEAQPMELLEARVLRLQPGDIVIYETPAAITSEAAANIKKQLRGMLDDAGYPGIPCTVSCGGTLLTARRVECDSATA